METCMTGDAEDRGVECALEVHLREVVNKCWNYAGRAESHQDEVMNAALGLTGEAGEVADQLKKMYFHTQKDNTFHLDKIQYELGDVLFYWLKIADLFNLDIKTIIDLNRAKLASRHPEMGEVNERFGEGAIR